MLFVIPVAAQTSPVPAAQAPDQIRHEHMEMDDKGWHVMQDGVVLFNLNRQGGPRGGTEFAVPNWWMGMFGHAVGRGELTLTTMLSLDPATVGKDGYREIFQVGESLNGRPLIDRQHPHDLFMQLAAVWRIPVGDATGLTIAGAPAGEPALGPVAFMHRASAAENPTAPLGHHTFDSTHIAFGVITGAIDHGRWIVEASLFNGREPDENRWDFDFGPLDSWSTRAWFTPHPQWEVQASTGHLKEPEELEPGDIQRSTISLSWSRLGDEDRLAGVTFGYGVNDTEHGTRSAFFGEGAQRFGTLAAYARIEAVQVESDVLRSDTVAASDAEPSKSTVFAATFGGVRDVWRSSRVHGAVGADITFYGVPEALRPTHGKRPVSLHIFFRLRPAAGPMGRRMWNMRMSQPMRRSGMDHSSMPMPGQQ